MKYYLIITGASFASLALAHFARLYAEGIWLLNEPIFVLTTVGSLAFCFWALFLFKRVRR